MLWPYPETTPGSFPLDTQTRKQGCWHFTVPFLAAIEYSPVVVVVVDHTLLLYFHSQNAEGGRAGLWPLRASQGSHDNPV